MYIEELRIGYCCSCDKPILNLKEKDPKKRKLASYREKTLELSDGSLMRVAVCDECEKSWTAEAAEKVMLRHHKTWKREIQESELIPAEKKAESLAHHLSLEVSGHDVTAHKKIKEAKERKGLEIAKDKTEKQKLEEENIRSAKKAEEAEKRKKEEEEERHNEILEKAEAFEKEAKEEEMKVREKIEIEMEREKEELKINAKEIIK